MTFDQQANEDFTRAIRKALWRRLGSWINKENNELVPYYEVRKRIPIQGHSFLGLQTVSLDKIIGSTFTDILELYENDPDTTAVVIYGEIGGTYEEQVAMMVKDQRFTKPIIAFISGLFAETLPHNLALGHAGAIIEGGEGTAKNKKELMKSAGITVANYHHEIPQLVKGALHGNQNIYQ